MSRQLRAELFKQRSTSTVIGLFLTMLALVLLAVALHGFGIAEERVLTADDQLTIVLGRGEFLGALFAGLLGALSVTGEFRHGTIRPTLLVTPWRGRVMLAKAIASAAIGAAFAFVACALAAVVGTAALAARGIEVELATGDYVLLLAGGAAAGAAWASIGVGVGSLVRNQVPALIGICAWVLFVEALLVGDVAGVGDVGRYAPGALGMAATGQDSDTLVGPIAGIVLLALYAVAAAGAGVVAARRDVA